jgi:hypothetical protein
LQRVLGNQTTLQLLSLSSSQRDARLSNGREQLSQQRSSALINRSDQEMASLSEDVGHHGSAQSLSLMIQRAIGDAQAKGTPVRKGKSGMDWKIVEAKQEDSKWVYTVQADVFGMIKQQTVAGDDDEWRVYIAQQTPEQLAMETVITQNLEPAVQGEIASLVVDESAISPVVQMDGEATTSSQYSVVWTGGSADCIAVGAYNGEQAFLAHGTQFSVNQAVRMALKRSKTIYLSSQHFRNGKTATETSTVKQIFTAFKDLLGLEPHQIQTSGYRLRLFDTGLLAINSKGQMLSQFVPPSHGLTKLELELLDGASGVGKGKDKQENNNNN